VIRGPGITEAQEEQLFVQMRQLGQQHEYMIKSMSGADQADSEMPRIQRLFYVAIWQGIGIEESLADCERQWRSYAAKNNARVEDAPKVSRGPYHGASSIHYRWVSPDRFESSAIHLRFMAKRILGEG
jgi:hypothetical protein